MRHRRDQIDRIDDEILCLLNRRARIALQLADEKRRRGLPVADPEREARVLARLSGRNGGPLSPEAIGTIYRAVMAEMRALQGHSDPA